MKSMVRRLCQALLFAAGLCALPGCFGGSQNPSYFPYLCPTGDIIRTHAKPPGSGYYANFDPHAVRLEVRPIAISTNPVRTQHVIIATVLDEKNQPRRDRRIEWMVEGVGNILEVDESGLLPGRGYKVDNKYAVSYTNYCEHQITRGNTNPNDDFVIRPGQTWCAISSAVEGDTHVTVYAPGIYDWQKRKEVVTIRWVDAGWVFPPPSVANAGSEQLLTTRVVRASEQQPLAGYHVRYKVIDGPPAMFRSTNAGEALAVSDDRGNATVSLAQLAPRPGVNRIAIEVVRPRDPTSPSGVGVVLASGETTVEWLAPSVTLTHEGPASAAVGQEVTYTIAVTNNGKVEAQAIAVSNPVPPGLQFLRADPPAGVDKNTLIWTRPNLPPGQTHLIRAVFKTLGPGTINNCARMILLNEKITEEKCVITNVGQTAGLKVSLTAPPTGTIGVPVEYRMVVTNTGAGGTGKVAVVVNFDNALEHSLGTSVLAKTVNMELDPIPPGQSVTLRPLILTPRAEGNLATRVTVTSNGLTDQASHVLAVAKQVQGKPPQPPLVQPQAKAAGLELSMTDIGDPVKVGGRVTYQVDILNKGTQDATQLEIKLFLPPELVPVPGASFGPTAGTIAGQVVTFAPLAALPPQKATRFLVDAEAKKAGDVRVRVEMRSPALTAGPVTQTESTTIFDPTNGGIAPAPGLPQPWGMPKPLPAGPKKG